jgi:hypothetical protein
VQQLIRQVPGYIPEDGNTHNYRWENLKSSINMYVIASEVLAPVNIKL